MPDLEKIRFLTAGYSRLQGLKSIPAGLVMFLIILWTNAQKGPGRDLTLPILLLFAGVGLYALIDRYYTRNFGRVEQTSRALSWDIILSLFLCVLVLGAMRFDDMSIVPVSFFALAFAFGLFLDYLRVLRLAGVKTFAIFQLGLVLLAGIALSALLPLLGQTALAAFGFRSPMFLVYAVDGILMVAYGAAGHVYLTRSMSSAQEVRHGQSV